jgi:D-alanyl-D-alanine endopeptidase (penicillin-binding protein 7)
MLKKKYIIVPALLLALTPLLEVQAAAVGIGLYRPQSTVVNSPLVVSQEQLVEVGLAQALSGASAGVAKEFVLDYGAGMLSAGTSIKLAQVGQKVDLPWNLQKISEVWRYEISGSNDLAKGLTVSVAYTPGDKQFKQLYYFDEVKKSWLALPSTDYPQESVVRAVITKPTAMLAIFAKPGTLTVGKASWYKYKNGDFAASPDFPKGSKLRVTNLDNGKSVEIVVNDWGPERDKHPDRAIDLDKLAFAKIASTGAGIINVAVSPIQIAPDTSGRVLGVKAEALGTMPTLASKSVMIMKESDGQAWMAKNGESVAPIASLSKVVAMSVYLDLQPELERIVDYKKSDEQWNLKYVKAWENTRVNLKEGAKLKARDLFNAALVGSANNAVEALVRQSGVSRDEFIAKMNAKVQGWGALNTKFVEPTGLSNKNVSSAHDYAIIVRESAKNKVLADASVLAKYSFTTFAKDKYTIRNTNKLIVEAAQLNLRAEQFPIISSKTGFLNEAGYCLMTRVKQGEDNYTIVTLGAPSREASFNEMADLINYVKFKNTWI